VEFDTQPTGRRERPLAVLCQRQQQIRWHAAHGSAGPPPQRAGHPAVGCIWNEERDPWWSGECASYRMGVSPFRAASFSAGLDVVRFFDPEGILHLGKALLKVVLGTIATGAALSKCL
jgi:hypothetical protein